MEVVAESARGQVGRGGYPQMKMERTVRQESTELATLVRAFEVSGWFPGG